MVVGFRIMACDREEKYDELVAEFADHVWRASNLISAANQC
jgi:hypothetical protein